MDAAERITLVAVDWGSTRLRVSAVGADGSVRRDATTDVGILSVDRARLGETLGAALAPIRADYPDAPVLAAGMIGSRNGMVETTPVVVPATVADVAGALMTVTLDDGTAMRIAPGLVDRSAEPVDLIRGEEVQVFGHLAEGADRPDAVLVLPGTHSKWVTVRGKAVTGFRTFLTGEMYARLREAPSLRPPVDDAAEADREDVDWFRVGVDLARLDGGLLRQLFAVRSRLLTDRLGDGAIAELLSGLVIATEISGALQAGLLVTGRHPTVIADSGLARRYLTAFAAEGVDAEVGTDGAFGRGIAAIAAGAPVTDTPPKSRDRFNGARSGKELHHG